MSDPKHKRGIRDPEPNVLPTELFYSELISLVSVECIESGLQQNIQRGEGKKKTHFRWAVVGA